MNSGTDLFKNTSDMIPLGKQPAIDYVMSLTPGGMHEGRDNILRLCRILGNPQDTLQVFHVTGSNGKWSVCQMIAQVLWKGFGKKVGLFTSPHFVKTNERFQINGVMVGDNDLNRYYEKVLKLAETHAIPLSFFEIQVVVMVLYFVEKKVDYAVVEVGLGGTFDGTNIFAHPLACFITSITLEHTHVLGKTRRSILRNKLGIVKPETRLYTWIDNLQVRETCQEMCAIKAPLSRGDACKAGGFFWKLNPPVFDHPLIESERCSPLRVEWPWQGVTGNTVTNLPWTHQQKNALLVLQALLDLGFDETTIRAWLMDIENPGRFQWLSPAYGGTSPTLLVDTANNRENVKILAKMITAQEKKIWSAIFWTTQTDPLYAAELANMISAERRILVDDFCDRALPCSDYAHLVKHDKLWHLHTDDWMNDLNGLNKLNWQNEVNIVYGSFYLVGEIMKIVGHQPFSL